MSQKPFSRRSLGVLVGVAAVLLVTLAALLATAQILEKMGDSAGQSVFSAVALAVGVLWAIDVVCLVLALGVNAWAENDDENDDSTGGQN